MTPSRHVLRWSWLLGLVAAIGCGGGGTTKPRQRALKGDLVIVGGTVVPMDREGVLADHTVVLRGDRIVAVAPAGEIDAGDATVVDARGTWVLPGLVDMHVHLWGQDALALFVLNGVTTVRNLTGSPETLRWGAAIGKGELAGPTLITSGPIIDGDPPTWPGSDVATTAEAARAAVRAQAHAGYHWIKVYSGLSIEAYDAVIDEARARGLFVGGHVPTAVGLDRVLDSTQRSIEHLDGYVPFFGEPAPATAVAATVTDEVWNCPTLVVTDRFGKMDDPAQLATTRGLELVSPLMRAAWEPKNDFRLRSFTPEKFEAMRAKNVLRRKLVGDLHHAGAKLVLGTDTGNPYVIPGFAVADELALLVASGLTPWQALRTATAAAAELDDQPGRFGVITPGARADLIVLARDPLADIANVIDPAVVVVRGKAHRRAELLAAAKAATEAPVDPFAALPALAPEGEVVATARYEILMHDVVIGGERVVVSRTADQQLVVKGQAVYTAPQASRLEYRSTRDRLELTSDTIEPARAVVSRQDPSPVMAAAAPDAVLAPQAIAEFVWYAAALAELPVGGVRTLTAVEVMTDGRLALHPGRFAFTRAADTGAQRVYTITGNHGELDLTGRLVVDADGAPREVTVTVKFGTFVTRRLD